MADSQISKRLETSPSKLPPLLDKSFLTELTKPPKEADNQDKINEYYSALKSQMSSLNSHIDNVLQRHEQDFLNAFKCQMYGMYAELKELKKKTNETEVKMKRDEEINRLQSSVNWFREEAVKLGENAQFYKKEADKWKAKAESLEDDRRFLEAQLRAAKAKLKDFHSESHRDQASESFITQRDAFTPAPFRSARNFVPTSRCGLIIFELMQKYSLKDGYFFIELEKYMNNQEKLYNEAIKHYKNTIDNEKKKFKSAAAQQSSIYLEKVDSESLFLECVEEVRKEVQRRKAKSMSQQKYGRRTKSSERKTRQDAFTPGDKRKILELLISNEQVLIMLYERLFPHRASQFSASPKIEKEDNPSGELPPIEEMMHQVSPKKLEDIQSESFQSKTGDMSTLTPEMV
ncbi:unnamed protein product [Blepharisma stoltei]|uniref:Uncharacterized protein n=1 Tax=Blepharisma stoltei TaxID=1481888 RepID=A0AAU9J4F0_9CILI|nr:unnamed protein product [Blepharisma stoltei]